MVVSVFGVVAYWPKSKEPTLMQMFHIFVAVVLDGVSVCQLTPNSIEINCQCFKLLFTYVPFQFSTLEGCCLCRPQGCSLGFRTKPLQQFIPVAGQTCPGNPNHLIAPCDFSSFGPDLESVRLCAWHCHAHCLVERTVSKAQSLFLSAVAQVQNAVHSYSVNCVAPFTESVTFRLFAVQVELFVLNYRENHLTE